MTLDELASGLTRETAIHHDVILRMRMMVDILPDQHPLHLIIEGMINTIKTHQELSLHELINQYTNEMPS